MSAHAHLLGLDLMQIYSLHPLVRYFDEAGPQIKQHSQVNYNTRQFTWAERDVMLEWKIVNGRWCVFQHPLHNSTLQDAIEAVKKLVGLDEIGEELVIGVRNLIVHLNPTIKQKNLNNLETLKNLIAEMYSTEAEDRFRLKMS